MKARPTMSDAELAAWEADMRTRAPVTRTGAPFETLTHGARSTYIAGCRCQPCTQANSVWNIRRRLERNPSLDHAERSRLLAVWTERLTASRERD